MKKYANYSDGELLVLLAQDDAEAFTAAYNKYWKLLFSIACKKLDSASEAEEIVQDIFLDLWKRRSSLQVNTSLSAYLSVSVNYKVFKVIARRQLYLKYAESSPARHEPEYNNAESLLDFEEVKERLFRLTAQLPEKCRLVFRMSREQSMTGREIAEELRISEKTVESHITRALHHLRTGFGSLLLFFFLK